MALGGEDVNSVAKECCAVHPDLYGPGDSVTLRHQHGPSVNPWPPAQPSGVIGATDVEPDPGCNRTSDPDTVPSGSSGAVYTRVTGSSAGHPRDLANF